jgi:hypothetical protein
VVCAGRTGQAAGVCGARCQVGNVLHIVRSTICRKKYYSI